MKFVCDNCKAKYQIGDEKVAGKTVRMKCKRCGFEIRVRAGSTSEAGEVASGDAQAADMDAPMPMSMSSGSMPAVAVAPAPFAPAPFAPAPRPAAPSAPFAPGPAAHGPGVAPAPPQRAPVGAPRPLAPRPPGAAPGPAPATHAAPAAHPAPVHAVHAVHSAPARPAPVGASAAPRPVGAARPVGVPAPARPVTRASGASSAAMAAVRPAVLEEAPHARPAPAAWAAADDESTALFSMANAPHPAESGPALASPQSAAVTGDADWYVGIAGTPLGPVHATTIRDRALAGEVDGESLVWREGLAEWRPLKTFPELVAMVTAAQHAAYAAAHAPSPAAPAYAAAHAPSPAAPAYAAAHAPSPAAPAYAAAHAPSPAAPAYAAAAPAAAAPYATPAPAPSVPVALVARPAPSPAAAAPLEVVGDPFVQPAPVAPSAQNGKSNGYHGAHAEPVASALAQAMPDAQPAPVVAPAPASVPQLASSPLPSAAPRVDAESDLDVVLGRKRGGTHPMAYAFIAAAAVFGGVAAYVLLSKPPAQIVVVQQVAATASTAAASGTPAADTAQVEVGELSTASPVGQGPRLGGPVRPKASASAVATAASNPIDTSGFNNSVPGPAATGPSGPSPSGGGQLSQGEIGAVVSQNQPLVKRKCWQPALEARAVNGPTNARVNGSITIGASGQVESASANGSERDFPGLSSCISARMKGWKFPPSGGPTSVNVPFVFAGQ